MNTKYLLLSLIKEKGGMISRKEIKHFVESQNRKSPGIIKSHYCAVIHNLSLDGVITKDTKYGKKCVTITKNGLDYLALGVENKRPYKRQVKQDKVKAQILKLSKPKVHYSGGDLVKDLLLSKFDQLSAPEKVGLIELYEILKTK